MNTTNKFYEENATEYFQQTINASMPYEKFLKYLKPNASIVDLGCGSGRDTKYFLSQGYQVEALDNSKALGELVYKTLGIPVTIADIETWTPSKKYDGIWACASLLHLEWDSIKEFMIKLPNILKKQGVIFISVKSNISTGYDKKGRYFTNLTEEMVAELLELTSNLLLKELWYTEDKLNRSDFKWLNFILENK